MPSERFWRDASGRLTFDMDRVEAVDYPTICRAVADKFDLVPEGLLVVGLDQMFWDFRQGDQVIALDWDIWMGFMVAAKSEGAELLVRDIAAWLDSSWQIGAGECG